MMFILFIYMMLFYNNPKYHLYVYHMDGNIYYQPINASRRPFHHYDGRITLNPKGKSVWFYKTFYVYTE
jgi:hypothetical protein